MTIVSRRLVAMRQLTEQSLVDLLTGCSILATGGGGTLERGLDMVRTRLQQGRRFILIELDELPDAAIIASPYYCGSLTPADPAGQARFKSLPLVTEPEACLAFKALQEFLGERFSAVISTELGGGNTASALATAADLDLPLVDADPAGRSVPELIHSTFFLNDLPIAPFALTTRYGDTMIVKHVADHYRAEAIARAVAVASGGSVGVTDHPLRAPVMAKAVIPGAISLAERIGRERRLAIQDGRDPVAAVLAAGGGYLLFTGVVEDDCSWATVGGFTEGEFSLSGAEAFAGSKYRVWLRNENMIAWRDGEVNATIPDLISVVETETARPLHNPRIKGGTRASVLGFPAAPQWRTPKGIEIFGPGYLGHSFPYVPIEQLCRR